MPLGFQSARGVYRDPSADFGFATQAGRATLTERDKTEVLDLDDFAHGGGVMHLGDRHVFWAKPRLFIGLKCCKAGQVVFVILRRTVCA